MMDQATTITSHVASMATNVTIIAYHFITIIVSAHFVKKVFWDFLRQQNTSHLFHKQHRRVQRALQPD